MTKRKTSIWRAIRVPAAAIAAVLTVSLLAFQNVAVICSVTGLFCTPALEQPHARNEHPNDPQPAAIQPPPAHCVNERLAPSIARLTPALGRADVAICKGDECGASFRLNERVTFRVTSEVSGAIVMLDVDQAGQEVQLLPNEDLGGEQTILAGERRRAPSEGGFVAAEVERGCVLVIVGPSNSAFSETLARSGVRTRGFRPAPATSEEVADPIAAAADADPNLAGWAFAWAAYEITP